MNKNRQAPSRTKPKPSNAACNVSLEHLKSIALNATSDWPRSYDPEVMDRYQQIINCRLGYAKILIDSRLDWRRSYSMGSVERFFGLGRVDHFFHAPELGWDMNLREPMATKCLVGLLGTGHRGLRHLRIKAFLGALGVPESDLDGDLGRCVVVAERKRIDMSFTWSRASGEKASVIVEAKFGHKITKGQLSRYRKAIKPKPSHSILLTINEANKNELHHTQKSIWRQVNWSDALLSFERSRPVESNMSLQIFLRSLWRRVGGLSRGNVNGCL